MRYIDLPDDARAFISETLDEGIEGSFTVKFDGQIDPIDMMPPWEILVTIDTRGHWIEYWEGTDYDDTPTTLYEPGRKGWDMELLWEGEADA
jgi:hypothetical protein